MQNIHTFETFVPKRSKERFKQPFRTIFVTCTMDIDYNGEWYDGETWDDGVPYVEGTMTIEAKDEHGEPIAAGEGDSSGETDEYGDIRRRAIEDFERNMFGSNTDKFALAIEDMFNEASEDHNNYHQSYYPLTKLLCSITLSANDYVVEADYIGMKCRDKQEFYDSMPTEEEEFEEDDEENESVTPAFRTFETFKPRKMSGRDDVKKEIFAKDIKKIDDFVAEYTADKKAVYETTNNLFAYSNKYGAGGMVWKGTKFTVSKIRRKSDTEATVYFKTGGYSLQVEVLQFLEHTKKLERVEESKKAAIKAKEDYKSFQKDLHDTREWLEENGIEIENSGEVNRSMYKKNKESVFGYIELYKPNSSFASSVEISLNNGKISYHIMLEQSAYFVSGSRTEFKESLKSFAKEYKLNLYNIEEAVLRRYGRMKEDSIRELDEKLNMYGLEATIHSGINNIIVKFAHDKIKLVLIMASSNMGKIYTCKLYKVVDNIKEPIEPLEEPDDIDTTLKQIKRLFKHHGLT